MATVFMLCCTLCSVDINSVPIGNVLHLLPVFNFVLGNKLSDRSSGFSPTAWTGFKQREEGKMAMAIHFRTRQLLLLPLLPIQGNCCSRPFQAVWPADAVSYIRTSRSILLLLLTVLSIHAVFNKTVQNYLSRLLI